jgi:hypothetical protein
MIETRLAQAAVEHRGGGNGGRPANGPAVIRKAFS